LPFQLGDNGFFSAPAARFGNWLSGEESVDRIGQPFTVFIVAMLDRAIKRLGEGKFSLADRAR
jgi:hypothetical protein